MSYSKLEYNIINSIPDKWQIKTLEDIVKRVKVGFVGSCNKDYCTKKEGVPMIRTTNLTKQGVVMQDLKYVSNEFYEKNKKSQLNKGDILVARHGHNGLSSLWDKDIKAQCLNVVVIETDEEKCNPQFLTYCMNSDIVSNQIKAMVVGSVQGVINTKSIAKLEIPYPLIEEQKRIVAILKSMDDKIQLNNEMNKTLEEMAQTLFKRWFVDFEFPDEEGKPYKSSGGEMVESELGMIPKGWSVCNLQDIAIINPRESIKKGEEKTFVEMANLPLNSARVMQTAIKEFKGGTKFRNGDILMARITPCLENGKTALVDFLDEDELAFGSTEYIIIRPEYLNSYYLYCLARDDEFRNYAIKNMNGSSGRQRVDAKYIKEYNIVKPTKELLIQYNEVCKSLFIKMKENDIESKSMKDIRDSLLPKLMSGEIRVDNVETGI